MTESTATSWYAPPLWRPVRQWRRSNVPEKYLSWLIDPASLTERIIHHCKQEFRVQLLQQTRVRPLCNEAMALGMRHNSRALVREVQLVCGVTPWVYARTVIPPRTLTRKSHRFTRLGARSLGALLFADPSMTRSEVEIARLTPGDALYQLVMRHLSGKPEVIWGRRSLFRLGSKPLLVSEFFLPDIALLKKC